VDLQEEECVLTPRMAASQQNGAAGGAARLRNTTMQQRQAISEKGGNAVLARYGHAYYKHIRECRKKAD
jgi:hypothetical protein